MTTIILGLGALTIVMGYMVRVKDKRIEKLENNNRTLKDILDLRKETYTSDIDFLEEKHAAEKQNWKQTSSAWILEKEEMIERLEREKFNQLHELALMLNDSYYVDEIILEKAEKFDWLVNDASREQKRNFIKGYIIK